MYSRYAQRWAPIASYRGAGYKGHNLYIRVDLLPYLGIYQEWFVHQILAIILTVLSY